MASEQAHLLKAEQTRRFLETLGDEFPDWLVIAAFYRAVHLVEALYSRHNVHSTKHNERNRRLKTEFPEIWVEFKPLYDVSRFVRYSERSVSAREARGELIEKRLAAVEKLVGIRLAPPAPAPMPPQRPRPTKP